MGGHAIGVLSSETAIVVNIQIIRVFTRIGEVLLTHRDVRLKLEQWEIKMIKQTKHEEEIQTIFRGLKQLFINPPDRRKIGYKINMSKLISILWKPWLPIFL